jgi:Polyketide cyclase / dehydrase and lipid transport
VSFENVWTKPVLHGWLTRPTTSRLYVPLNTTMKIESRITIATLPETLFAIYADVSNWNKWDPDTKSSSLEGPFEIGSVGRLAPTRGREVPMSLVSVVPNRSFTVECRIPLFRMVFEHELTPHGSLTDVVHRVSFSGPLTFLFGPLVGGPLRKSLPQTLKSLKQYAESAAHQHQSDTDALK